MAISINQLKAALTILSYGEAYAVVELNHVKPGKGAAFVRTKLKNLKTGSIIERTFRGDEKIEEAFVEQKKLQFSYRAGDSFHFLDQNTFEEIVIPQDKIKEETGYLKDNVEVTAFFYNHELLNINLPISIELKVIQTEAGLKGDSSRAGTKSAKLETGKAIQVPLFINEGDFIKVDTRTGEYLERV